MFLWDIPQHPFYGMPECVRNFDHLSQLSECLVAAAFAVPFVALRMTLSMLSNR